MNKDFWESLDPSLPRIRPEWRGPYELWPRQRDITPWTRPEAGDWRREARRREAEYAARPEPLHIGMNPNGVVVNAIGPYVTGGPATKSEPERIVPPEREKRGHDFEFFGEPGEWFHRRQCWCADTPATRVIRFGYVPRRVVRRRPGGLNWCGWQVGLKIGQWTTSEGWRAICQVLVCVAVLITALLCAFTYLP